MIVHILGGTATPPPPNFHVPIKMKCRALKGVDDSILNPLAL